jgi:methylated-DNA-protein-cysteine methyltransferase related protein
MAAGFRGIAVADSEGMDCVVKSETKNSRKRAGTKSAKSSQVRVCPDEPSKIRMRIEAAIRNIPKGKVSTYGAVARAAGLPGAARQVAKVLHRGFGLPWQRVLGAGGEVKLRGDSAIEQRFRLQAEGVHFRGRKVDMKRCEYIFARAGAEKNR